MVVMPALVADIHVGAAASHYRQERSLVRQGFRSVATWIAGTSPAMTALFLLGQSALNRTAVEQARA
jgi:hypothetical protein